MNKDINRTVKINIFINGVKMSFMEEGVKFYSYATNEKHVLKYLNNESDTFTMTNENKYVGFVFKLLNELGGKDSKRDFIEGFEKVSKENGTNLKLKVGNENLIICR